MFLDAYEDESTLRRVFWLQKGHVPITEQATFDDAAISRKNILFQTMFKRVVIGIVDIELQSTMTGIDQSNCKLPEKLGAFLDEWKSALQRMNEVPSWDTHYRLMQEQGLPASKADSFLGDLVGAYTRCAFDSSIT